MSQITLSPLDKERFGIKTAKTFIKTTPEIQASVDEAKAQHVKLLIARSYVSEIRLAQKMENNGFFLTDTLVYYAYDLTKKPIPQDTSGNEIRPVLLEEADQVKNVAKRAFKGYFGHYHADEKLDSRKSDDVYTDWAKRACLERTQNDEVFVAVLESEIMGFATMRLNSSQEGEGVLFAVDPAMQGKGIYRSFILAGLTWCKEKGCDKMVVSTQINNIAVQKVWTRTGFEPIYAYYTFHKWFIGD